MYKRAISLMILVMVCSSGCTLTKLFTKPGSTEVRIVIAEAKMTADAVKDIAIDIAKRVKELKANNIISNEDEAKFKKLYENIQQAQSVFLDSIKNVEVLYNAGLKTADINEVIKNKRLVLTILIQLQDFLKEK